MAEFFSVEALSLHGSPNCTIFPLQVGSEASNFTQVSLQPSCAYLWLKPHPLSNKLVIVMALGQWLPLECEKLASLPEMEALHGQKTVL